ncbi:MAG: hypothetical protein ABI587_10040 [Gemmatimonadales bacterium]
MSDLSYVVTSRVFVNVGLVIDSFARRIEGRRAFASLRSHQTPD